MYFVGRKRGLWGGVGGGWGGIGGTSLVSHKRQFLPRKSIKTYSKKGGWVGLTLRYTDPIFDCFWAIFGVFIGFWTVLMVFGPLLDTFIDFHR